MTKEDMQETKWVLKDEETESDTTEKKDIIK